MKYHKAIKNKLEPYQFIWRAFHKMLLRKEWQDKDKEKIKVFG